MQPILIDLVPVHATLFDVVEADYGAEHNDEVYVVVPDHLPKVGEGVAGALRLGGRPKRYLCRARIVRLLLLFCDIIFSWVGGLGWLTFVVTEA